MKWHVEETPLSHQVVNESGEPICEMWDYFPNSKDKAELIVKALNAWSEKEESL